MEYVLESVGCYLKISNIRVFEGEINLPTNTSAWVSVSSGSFSGATEFDIDAKLLGEFSVQLKNMFETLKGNALLEETYGPSLIKIEAVSLGHFRVSGKIVLSYPPNLLEFEFDVDQTMIKDFSSMLYKDFAHFV
jgi:hypothetical protein